MDNQHVLHLSTLSTRVAFITVLVSFSFKNRLGYFSPSLCSICAGNPVPDLVERRQFVAWRHRPCHGREEGNGGRLNVSRKGALIFPSSSISPCRAAAQFVVLIQLCSGGKQCVRMEMFRIARLL